VKPPEPQRLSTGAEMRMTNPLDDLAVVCVNGGQGGDVEGTWSASIEWLVRRLAPDFPRLAFAEVRFRIKSWNRLGMCVEDAQSGLAAVSRAGARRALLLGFSMGGAVAIGAAEHPSVSTVVGLAPWIPDRLDLSGLAGRRLAVVHGMLDRYIPGIPGVSPSNSRRGFERARRLGAEGDYTLIPGALHGIALRAHWGRPLPLPRAGRWAELVGEELERFAAAPA
jgi:dienelactone hydrolase